MKIRLDKYLADMSAATRGDVKRQIVKGMVEVDKKVVKRPDTKIDTDINLSLIHISIESSGGTKIVKPSAQAEADIKFGYCTEFIIMTEKAFTDQEETEFKAYLESIGDSIVCVADDDIVKIHVHTNDPGLAIQKALTYGQLSRMDMNFYYVVVCHTDNRIRCV